MLRSIMNYKTCTIGKISLHVSVSLCTLTQVHYIFILPQTSPFNIDSPSFNLPFYSIQIHLTSPFKTWTQLVIQCSRGINPPPFSRKHSNWGRYHSPSDLIHGFFGQDVCLSSWISHRLKTVYHSNTNWGRYLPSDRSADRVAWRRPGSG